MVQSAKLQALSAAIPHVGIKHQKRLAVAVKLMEIREICRHYDNLDEAGEAKLAPGWRQDVIKAISPHVSEARQQDLAQLAQFMEMKEIISNFKELSQWI